MAVKDEKAVRRARDKLIAHNLLEYKSGSKGHPGQYKLCSVWDRLSYPKVNESARKRRRQMSPAQGVSGTGHDQSAPKQPPMAAPMAAAYPPGETPDIPRVEKKQSHKKNRTGEYTRLDPIVFPNGAVVVKKYEHGEGETDDGYSFEYYAPREND